MMMLVIECPKCHRSNGFLLEQSAYEGPFRCWKCRGAFMVTIKNDKLKSCKPISDKEFEKYTK
jgi:hypothetical protein